MEVVTGWVARPSTTGGLDHLGSQQPCIELYSRLLPGITNVTDRARYYSIYTWFAWSYDRRIESKEADQFVSLFRRADCLLTLITERFARRNAPRHERDGAAMVGREALLPALHKLEQGSSLRLSGHATLEDAMPTRYFKNRLGGLGQYYLGTLQELGLLSGDVRPWIKYTHERGAVVARLVDKQIPGDLFFQTLEEDEVSLSRLDKLSDFAFGRIPDSKDEQQFLLDLFFDRKGEHGADGKQRRLSLGLLLSLVDAKSKGSVDANFAKDALYGLSLGTSGSWEVPTKMHETAAQWRLYCRNDLFSIAVQTIFFTALYIIQEESQRFSTADEIGAWMSKHPGMQNATRRIGRTWGRAVSQSEKRLPQIEDWLNKDHEIQLRRALFESFNNATSETALFETIGRAVELLVALAARTDHDNPAYANSLLSDDVLAYYPINLESMRRRSIGAWREMPLHELAGWLVSQWGIATHIHIAIRKLRSNPKATFRVRPTDLGFVVEPDIPPPAPTSPRLKQSLQILEDLGLIKVDPAKKATSLSALGQSVLGECLDR